MFHVQCICLHDLCSSTKEKNIMDKEEICKMLGILIFFMNFCCLLCEIGTLGVYHIMINVLSSYGYIFVLNVCVRFRL